MNFAVLASELSGDPLGRGYAGMTNSECADSLNTPDRSVERPTLSGAEIFEAMDLAEYSALDPTTQERVRFVVSLGEQIQISDGTKARDWLLEAFGPGTETRTALTALAIRTLSRGQELGLGFVRPGEVQHARGLP